uniref:FACT complex subunit n=1 Tax=Plectus sambesii TaxID=2011161 RepID=A0A914VZ60_9BILA
MSEKRVNSDRFLSRIGKLYECWNKAENDTWDKLDALVFMVGSDDADVPYSKSTALQTWLFGYEMADTLTVMTRDSVHFLASSRKAQFLKPIESEEQRGSVPPVKCHDREKADKDQANFTRLIKVIKDARNGKVIGHFEKDKFKSDFATAWKEATASSGFEKIDVASAMAGLMAVKDDAEIALIKQAAKITCDVWNASLRTKIIDIIDQEKKVKHERLAEETEKAMQDVRVIGNVRKDNVEPCYTPIIQSGGNYSLKLSAESDSKNMHFGSVVSSLGVRYQSYCSNVSRTMMVDPPKSIETAYEQLVLAEVAIVNALKPGVKLSAVYEAGVKAIRDSNADLVDKLVKGNFGFATGLEFREGAFLIGPKCNEVVKAGMVFVVYIGLSGLSNPKGTDEQSKEIAILISDTVLIQEGGCVVLTEAAKSRSKIRTNIIRFKEETEQGKEDNKENRAAAEEILGRGKRSVVLQDQTRNKTTNEDKRKQRQKELGEQLNRVARDRLAEQTSSKDVTRSKKSTVSYKSYEKFPKEPEVNNLSIYVDRKHDSVILPVFGIPVPFHISMIKNTSQSVEGDFTYLRINFTHPGSQIGRDSNQFPNPLSTYLKELTYRSSNVKEPGEISAPSSNLLTAFRLIKEMQKKFRTQEAEEREKEGAVKQDKLLLSQNKGNPRLKDLFVRPNIIAKRISGTLEAHLNGFRYTSLRGDKIDVLYNNIKHAFFQPCDNEMIILLHFNLKYPVLWGKRKYLDIQFYTEVGEITTDLGKYHHMQDRDDIMTEQVEREMRNKLNQAFRGFCDKVERQTNNAFDFDSPFGELGFFGVPFRSSCTLKPTSACLVNLTEWPPFVITLDEVELVHFERVSFQLKNFDMVFIFKDYHRKTQMVQQIPMSSLDNVKEWLNSCELRYTEGIQSLNWAKIMKTITDDPEEFFNTGGWNFLSNESDEEGEADSDDSEDAYDPTDVDSEEEDESEEDEDESPDATSESESEASVDSDESSGKDWSDLEEEARNADKMKDEGVEVDPRRKDKRKPPPSSKKGGPPPKRRK